MKGFIQRTFHHLGIDIRRYPNAFLRSRISLFNDLNINTIFDIGANRGQFAKEIRKFGFNEKIISFEPLPEAFSILQKKVKNNSNWIIVEQAIGNFDGKIEINIAKNSASSSILEMLPEHLKNAPQSAYVGKTEVSISRIDSIFDKYVKNGDKVFVKIDTQGFEKNVIEGCENVINEILGFQLEMSITPLYKGEVLFYEIVELLFSKGFSLYSIEPGFWSPITGELLQMDGIFYKRISI